MNCLDSSFLIDYLRGNKDTKAFMGKRAGESFHAPSLVLYELYDGLDEHTDRTFSDIDSALDWVNPLSFTMATAKEAIRIKQELSANGTMVNVKDIMIAGVIRDAGGHVVTRDAHFERIEGIDVVSY